MARRAAERTAGRASASRAAQRSQTLLLARIALIALVTLALLGLALLYHPVGDYRAESDFYGGYREGALMLRHGVIDPARYGVVGPMYETLLALLGVAGGDLFTIAKLISVASAAVVLIAWSSILACGAGEAASIWIVALLAVNPTFDRHGYSAATDMPALAFASLALLLLVLAVAQPSERARRTRKGPSDAVLAVLFAAGVLAGLAALTRYSAALLLPAGALAIMFAPPAGAERGRSALVLTLGFAFATGPWIAYSMSHGHVPGAALFRWFGFYAASGGNPQDFDPHHPDALHGYRSLADLWRADAGGFVRRALANVPRHLERDARQLIGVPAAALAALGLIMLAFRRAGRSMTPVWVAGALLVLGFAPLDYGQRYLLPLAPIELSLAAIGLATPITLMTIPAGFVALALSARASYDEQREVRRLLPLEVREAGRALAAASRPGDRVMSRNGQIGYYAGLDVVPLPRVRSLAELADAARANRAGFLYYSWYEALQRPEVSWLLDTSAVVPGLTLVRHTPRRASVVYRIGPDFGRDPDWLADPRLHRLHEARAMVDVLPESLTAAYRVTLAVDALERREPDTALALCDQAVRYLPREPLVWQTRGRAYLALSRDAEAEQAFERAMQLEPADADTRRGLGVALARQGKSPEAARAWAGLVTDTDDAELLALMRDTYKQTGDRVMADSARLGLWLIRHGAHPHAR